MSAPGPKPVQIEKNELFEVANKFWNIRVSFKLFAGFADLGSQMSLIQLKNGNFLVIDTVLLTDQTKASINLLTDNGKKIEAVLGTHPFHTLAFPTFYEAYPNAAYYGTPRHLRRLTQIPWTGSLEDCHIRKKWEPEVEMRIPAGKQSFLPSLINSIIAHKVANSSILCPNPTIISSVFLYFIVPLELYTSMIRLSTEIIRVFFSNSLVLSTVPWLFNRPAKDQAYIQLRKHHLNFEIG